MSAPVAVQPLVPADETMLTTVLDAMRRWTPLDGEALLDDVGVVLDDSAPCEGDVEEIGERLRGHLMRLVAITTAARTDDVETGRMILRAREVRAEDMPGDYWRAVSRLRRMAWTVNELLEHLGAIRCLKEYA
ncbi:DUF6415 family natural product biosynthesis protein [Streptomyces sp. AC627_RSS907]|uniref:DUF6415 family natural product biosynthesis protein n=1 Tax=Streptomyces sp. AC627_RSS907 TaxID=2823684 RepID=UPI0027E48727|nr:DUF6415 family natural product biosynthesis protein [Streptomyces sp. AC627_RSS907]